MSKLLKLVAHTMTILLQIRHNMTDAWISQFWSCIVPSTRSWTIPSCVRFWRSKRWSRTWSQRVPLVSQQTCSPSSRLHPAPIRGHFKKTSMNYVVFVDSFPSKNKITFFLFLMMNYKTHFARIPKGPGLKSDHFVSYSCLNLNTYSVNRQNMA